MRTLLAFLLLVLTCLPACGRAALDDAATAAKAAEGIARQSYLTHQLAAVEKAATKEQARANVSEVREQWRPFWFAWDEAREALRAWAEAEEMLERVGDGDARAGAKRAAREARRHAEQALCGAAEVAPVPLPMLDCEGER